MNIVRETQTPIGFDIDGESVRINDTVDGGSLRIDAIGSDGFQPALTDRFVFPVDAAISCTAETVRVHINTSVRVRNENGEDLGDVTVEPWKLPLGTHILDINTEIKTFVRFVETPLSVAYVDNDQYEIIVEVTLPEPAVVLIGARSLHSEPAETITVSDEPHELMEAVSHLGSSIKEFSAERSWPSLRGHPPRIKIGDSLSIPPSIQKPETGVRITVPPNLADIYRVAPLAFYLGATVEPGDTAALHLDTGHSKPFKKRDGSIEPTVDEQLRRCLFLDTLVRIGGYYSLPRYEYDALGDDLPFYPPNLYDRSISDQLMEYLEVPYEQIEPYIPTWSMTATLCESPGDAALIPYICNVLGTVHVEKENEIERTVRSKAFASTGIDCYSSGSIPPGGTMLSVDSFERGLTYEYPDEESVSFGVILEDVEEAQTIRTVLRSGETAVTPEQVEIISSPTKDNVIDLLKSNHEFVYCSVPVTSGQINCIDGTVSKASEDFQSPPVWMGNESKTNNQLVDMEPNGFVEVQTVDDVQIGELVTILDLLRYGCAVALAVSLALGPGRARFIGNSDQELVRVVHKSPAVLIEIQSKSPSTHHGIKKSAPTRGQSIGSVYNLSHDVNPVPTQPTFQLQGAINRYQLPWQTETVLKWITETGMTCRFNDRFIFGRPDISETEIEQWAKEAIERRNNDTADAPMFDPESSDDPIE